MLAFIKNLIGYIIGSTDESQDIQENSVLKAKDCTNMFTRMLIDSGMCKFSPYGVNYCLGVLSLVSDTDTKKELERIIKDFANVDYLTKSKKTVDKDGYVCFKHVTMLNSDREYTKECKDMLALVGDVEYFDKNNLYKAVANVNELVSKHSNEDVKKVLDVDMITPLMELVMVNVVYYKMYWRYAFDEKETRAALFNGKTQFVVSMMHNRFDSLGYYEDDIVQMIRLPYVVDGYVMDIVLPKQEYVSIDYLDYFAMESFFTSSVDVSLPKFIVENTVELSNIVSKTFLDYKSTNSMCLSKAYHKVVVHVDEAGTIATSTDAVFLTKKYIEFNANHTFHYCIKRDEELLFFGQYGANLSIATKLLFGTICLGSS